LSRGEEKHAFTTREGRKKKKEKEKRKRRRD
jgi:hypothetical protein